MARQLDGDDDRPITASDIARERGCHHTTAWRLLRDLERKHGAVVVTRRARKELVTTYARLRAAELGRPLIDPRIERRLSALESRVSEAEYRTDGLARELAECRRRLAARS